MTLKAANVCATVQMKCFLLLFYSIFICIFFVEPKNEENKINDRLGILACLHTHGAQKSRRNAATHGFLYYEISFVCSYRKYVYFGHSPRRSTYTQFSLVPTIVCVNLPIYYEKRIKRNICKLDIALRLTKQPSMSTNRTTILIGQKR